MLSAIDFGFTFDQNLDIGSRGYETILNYGGIGIPRLSGLIGEQSGFYVSLGFNYENDPFGFVPEILRTEVSLRSGFMELRIGRMHYQDPLAFIVTGLFDGLSFSYNTLLGKVSTGVWYSGLLYKGRANIEMTYDEFEHNFADLDYYDFLNTYFAPRRLLAALEWEHQGIGELVLAQLSLLTQFDLSGAGLNTQYLTGRVFIPIWWPVAFNLGGSLSSFQVSNQIYIAHAGEIGFSFQDQIRRFAFTFRSASGPSEYFTSFLPITTISQGNILKAKLSGISHISMDYTMRLHRTFTFNFSGFYFFENGPNERWLGPELSAGLFWNPISDISINLGGGIFIPALGDVRPESNNYWRLDLRLILSII